jgi:hypothetical protein
MNDSTLRIYLDAMPRGQYHRRDDDPCGLYRDGSKVFDIHPRDAAADSLVGALVYLLNQRLPPIDNRKKCPRCWKAISDDDTIHQVGNDVWHAKCRDMSKRSAVQDFLMPGKW